MMVAQRGRGVVLAALCAALCVAATATATAAAAGSARHAGADSARARMREVGAREYGLTKADRDSLLELLAMPVPTPSSLASASAAASASPSEDAEASGGSAEDGSGDDGSAALDEEGSEDEDTGTNVVLANSNSIENYDDGSKQRMAQEQSRKRMTQEQRGKVAEYNQQKRELEERTKARQNELKEDNQKSEQMMKLKEKNHREALAEQQDKAKERERESKEKFEVAKNEAELKEKARTELEAANKKEATEKEVAKKQEAERKTQETAEKKTQEEKAKAEAKEKEAAAEAARKKEEEQKATPLNLNGNFQPYNSGYETPSFVLWGNMVFVSGLARGWSGLIGTLPSGARPNGGRLIFALIRGGTNCRVDVLDDGRVFYIAGGESADWISLNGIIFDVNVQQGLNLVWGWQPYGWGYRQVSQNRQSDFCIVSGLIRSGSWGYFAYTRSDCNPSERLIFSANNHDTITRVDLLSNGYLLYSGGYTHHGWVSLDGITWVPGSGGSPLSLFNGWADYYSGYRQARFLRTGRVCALSGLIRSSSWAHHITTLPEGCRPRARVIFMGNVHMRSARIDVTREGQVLYVSHRMQWDWISLDNIKFIAQA